MSHKKRQEGRACVTFWGSRACMSGWFSRPFWSSHVTIYGFTHGNVYSIVIIQRVKMGDLPDFTQLLKSPERLQLKCIIKMTNSIIVMELTEKYDVHRVIPHDSRDDISIDRLEVSCPGNRFDQCTGWENFHISCYVSRAFHSWCPGSTSPYSRYCVMRFCAEGIGLTLLKLKKSGSSLRKSSRSDCFP